MNVSLSVYRSRDEHHLTVVARPHTAAVLGEYALLEGVPMPAGERPDDSALALLRQAYTMIAEHVSNLGGTVV